MFAFLLGCAAAFDSPARHTFIAELVDEPLLPNAVALNSTSFHAARMIGPAVAGGIIAAIGSGGAYALAAARALKENTKLSAREIVEKAMHIAASICVFTNDFITIEEL